MSGIQLREVFGFGYTVGIQREEDACFLFSQVQYFKNGIAYPFRSECADAAVFADTFQEIGAILVKSL